MNIETNKLRNEEMQKTTVAERLEKALHDLHQMKNEHITVQTKMSIKIALFYFSFDFVTLSYLLIYSFFLRCSCLSIWYECLAHWRGVNARRNQLRVQIQLYWPKHCWNVLNDWQRIMSIIHIHFHWITSIGTAAIRCIRIRIHINTHIRMHIRRLNR